MALPDPQRPQDARRSFYRNSVEVQENVAFQTAGRSTAGAEFPTGRID
jgi:hypothetical protein